MKFRLSRSVKISIVGVLLVLISVYIFIKIDQFCVLGVIGDCESTSKTTVVDITNQLMSIDNSISQSINQACIATSSASNVLNIINSKLVGASIEQQNIIKNTCSLQSSFSSSVSADAQNKVAATIAQYAKSEGGFLGAASNTEAVTNAQTNIDTDINNGQLLKSVKDCVLNMNLDNVINIVNSSVTNTSIKQINDQFIQCLASDVNTSALAAQAQQASDRKIEQTAESKGTDVFKTIFDGISTVFATGSLAILLPIALVFIFLFYYLYSATGDVVNSEAVTNLSQNEELMKNFAQALSANKAAAPTAAT